MSDIAVNPYDEIPFPSQPLRHSQPQRLEAIAALFGMRPAPADRCRVLELGCATGGNLIPLADQFPNGRFVGIDYSQVQIDSARRIADALGLTNLELKCAGIADVGDKLGQFDYVICHGVYSWVPRDVQDAILNLCRTALNPQGVAYISYNTYPAWYLRLLARRLFLSASPNRPAAQGLAGGRARLKFLSGAIAGDTTPFGKLLSIELNAILGQSDEYLLHEYLEYDNEPLYFHEFAARAAAAGLAYLGDADPSTMFAANYGPATAGQLQRITNDAISIEQHLDVLCNRGFRRTLLCQQEVSPSRRLLPDRLAGLHFSGKLVLRTPSIDFKSWSLAEFGMPDGSKISHKAPLVKALLHYFSTQWPRSVSVDELTDAASKLIPSDALGPNTPAAMREAVILNVVRCVASGIAEATSMPDGFTTTLSRSPQGSRLARLQACNSPVVTNRRHECVQLDEQSRKMFGYLDGQRDQDALLAELVQAVKRGEMVIPHGGADVTALSGILQKWLTTLAGQALLVS